MQGKVYKMLVRSAIMSLLQMVILTKRQEDGQD